MSELLLKHGETLPLERAEELPLPHWKLLARVPEAELGTLDVAFVQFVAHMGLPDSEKLNPWGCIHRLNAMADRVRAYTDRQMDRFHRNPVNFENSEAYFRALCLATVLQKEFGVRYDPDKVPRDVPFGVGDTTVHGTIFGHGGTCASLAVLYASVGRQLGYPLKLVTCYVDQDTLHQFARWDGGGERFNIEATGTGLGVLPDDYYRSGKYRKMTPECERLGRHMLSQTPRMELGSFLRQRALHWSRAGNLRRRTEAYAWSLALDPLNALAEDQLKLSLNDWTAWTEVRQPSGFPSVRVEWPRGHRFFPESLERHYEHQILGLMGVENLLRDPEYGRVWERMRSGEWKGRRPNQATVRFEADGTSAATGRHTLGFRAGGGPGCVRLARHRNPVRQFRAAVLRSVLVQVHQLLPQQGAPPSRR